MDEKVLELLYQLVDGQKQLSENQKRMESHMETRLDSIETRLDSLENEVKDVKEDIRAVRIETSRAFTEAVNPTTSKLENIELDVKMLKRVVTNQ